MDGTGFNSKAPRYGPQSLTRPSGNAPKSLPVEKLPSTSARRIQVTVWGVLALVILSNVAASWYLHWRPLNHGYRVIRAKWQLLEEQRQPVDWLILGDSSGNQGVVPAVLGGRLGGSALNLCTVGGLVALNDAWMLQAYIDRAGAPRHVLIVHAYDVWHRQENLDALAQIPLPLGYWNRLNPPISLRGGQVARVLLDRYVPLYSQDRTLSALALTPRRVLGRGFDMDPRGFLKVQEAIPADVLSDARSHRDFLSESRFSLSDVNRESLKVIAALAERHDFPVYVASAPLYEGLFREPVFRAYFESLRQTLDRFSSDHPRLHVIGGDPIVFPANEMLTVDHLVYDSARRYTESLAEQIAAVAEADGRLETDRSAARLRAHDGSPQPIGRSGKPSPLQVRDPNRSAAHAGRDPAKHQLSSHHP